MLKILEERTPGLVHEIDIAELTSLISDMQPLNFWPHMGMLSQEVGDIAHAAPHPVAQGKKRFSSNILCLLNQDP